MAGVVPQADDRVPAGLDLREVQRQPCRTNDAPSAWYSQPSAVASVAVDQEGAIVLAAVPSVVDFADSEVASVAAPMLVATVNMARAHAPGGSVVKENILAVPGLAALK